LFISEVRYQRNETARTVKATDARAFSAKSTAAHVQITESTLCDAEANASTNITPAMQSLIDAGIAKGLALALKTVSLTSKGTKGSFFCFAHHENKSHSTEDCEFLKSKGFNRQLNKEMFQMKKPGTTKNGEVSGEKVFKRNVK
jgi:hypothetical protein